LRLADNTLPGRNPIADCLRSSGKWSVKFEVLVSRLWHLKFVVCVFAWFPVFRILLRFSWIWTPFCYREVVRVVPVAWRDGTFCTPRASKKKRTWYFILLVVLLRMFFCRAYEDHISRFQSHLINQQKKDMIYYKTTYLLNVVKY
jgi:hypothetical protein